MEIKRHVGLKKIILGDFNNPLSTLPWSLRVKPINKEISGQTNQIRLMEFIELHQTVSLIGW